MKRGQKPTAPPRPSSRLKLLDEVIDKRHPERIGKFQQWVLSFGSLWMAAVKFPGNPAIELVPVERIVAYLPIKNCRVNAIMRDPAAKVKAQQCGLSLRQYALAAVG